MKKILLALMLGWAAPVAALEERHSDSGKPHTEEQEAHSEGQEARVSSDVGPGKAVTAADPQRGIQLSEKAMQALGLKLMTVSALPVTLPKEAIVASREVNGVYRLRDGWFRLVQAGDLRTGDQIVVQGSGLLRVAELASFESGGGHHH